MGDPCAPYRGTAQPVASRSCYEAIWKEHCATDFWKEYWRGGGLRKLSYEALVADTLAQKAYRCWPKEIAGEVCQWLAEWLDWAATLLHTGFLPEHDRGSTIGDEEVVDITDVSRTACEYSSVALRMLLQRAPEVFTNRSRRLARHRRLHLGVSISVIRAMIFSTRPLELLGASGGVFGALRAASEAPFSRELRRAGAGFMDDCARTGFASRQCMGLATSAAGTRRNVSLLAAFYRQRDPGLAPELISRLMRQQESELLRISGMLAIADRRRNLGEPFAGEAAAALEALRAFLGVGPTSLEALLPDVGPPGHLVFHFLDKLALKLVVRVPVRAPAGAAAGGLRPVVPEVDMFILPDRDVISDHIRRNHDFHCPGSFQRLVLELAAEAGAGQASGDAILRVAEVGGFLGDCVLWACAWLGPSRLRAVEVEPVAAATARLRRGLERSGCEGSVHVLTEALGDGAPTEMAAASVGGGRAPAHPNFSVRHGQSGAVTVAAPRLRGPCHAAAGCGEARLHLRALDEVLAGWSALDKDGFVDLVRIKAAGSEPLIAAGLRGHLSARRVRRLLVETHDPKASEVKRFMAQWPWYVLAENRVPTMIFKLVEEVV